MEPVYYTVLVKIKWILMSYIITFYTDIMIFLSSKKNNKKIWILIFHIKIFKFININYRFKPEVLNKESVFLPSGYDN
jgi:hypothetical protein